MYFQYNERNYEFDDSTGKIKANRNCFKYRFIIFRYLTNPLYFPLMLAIILFILTLDSFKKYDTSLFFSDIFKKASSIDPQTHNFFEATETNLDFYKKINNYISPNHEPIGFQNDKLKRLRTEPGSPPIISDPGIFSLDNTNEKIEIPNKYHGFSRFFNFIITLGGIFSKNDVPKRQIYIILGNSPNIGIEREISCEDWLIEKISIINKKSYANRHNYQLIYQNSNNDLNSLIKERILDSVASHQKRYQHENREGWERFDIIRQAMKIHSYNDPRIEEWYWYLDLQTLIMHPERSIEEVIFSNIEKASDTGNFLYNSDSLDDVTDKDLTWSSLAYRRDLSRSDLDPDSSKHQDIDLILSEDCFGISLNSFFIRRSKWSELLLDTLWEPVMYRQMHLEWNKLKRKDMPNNYEFSLNKGDEILGSFQGNPSEMEERNCLEYFLNTQAWLRTRTIVLPAKIFSSLSEDSCVIDSAKSLDLIDIDMDDELIDALLDSSHLDLQLILENLSNNPKNSKINELKKRLSDLHYQNSDFIYNFAACRSGCDNRVKSALSWYKSIHDKHLFDDLY